MIIELKQVSLNDGKNIFDMIKEIGPGENGFGNSGYEMSYKDFPEYLKRNINMSKGINLKLEQVPQTMYWLYVEGIPVGMGKLRDCLTDNLKRIGGHVGYTIRPSERGKGYGKIILMELLKEAKNKTITEALLTCNEDNISSRKVIEANNGELEVIVEGKCRYWIRSLINHDNQGGSKVIKQLELKDIVLVGRTFGEYYKMFNLHEIKKDVESILDVGSGVSSFCSEAMTLGYNVTASDRVYSFAAEEIEEKCANDLETVMEKLPDIMDLYKWEYFKNINELKERREYAYRSFIKDFKLTGNSRYKFAEFPETKFEDNQFTISLVSHFLFLYDEHLDYEFHKKALLEIIRITSNEIRIFPLVNLKGTKSSFVDQIMKDEDFAIYNMKIEKTNYEFVKGGNEMLIIGK